MPPIMVLGNYKDFMTFKHYLKRTNENGIIITVCKRRNRGYNTICKRFLIGERVIMQDLIYLFPFEDVQKGEDIIIYGAGNVGQSFLAQIAMTGYCNVIAVADRSFDKYPYLGQTMIPPENIPEYEYDRIVIAVDGDTRFNAMKEVLAGLGIDNGKVISGSGRLFEPGNEHAEGLDLDNSVFSMYDYSYKNTDDISIAFFLAGGLGDCIVNKKFITALLKEANVPVSVDIYGDMYNTEAIRSFYRDCPEVKNVIEGKMPYRATRNQYDLAISVLTFAIMDHFDEESIRTKDETFCDLLVKLREAIENYGLTGAHLADTGVNFARMRYRNENVYTIFSYGGLLDIHDMDVTLALNPNTESEYNALELPKEYITINYGWGNNVHGEYKAPNKVWPFEYYETLVDMIKNRFPNLIIVQTGKEYSPKIKNVDRCIFSMGIDTLEYVLKNTQVHFDCEGGLVHLATQLGTKCVVVFGPSRPEIVGYPQNENIASGVCEGCISLTNDFSQCLHINEDRECMYSISPEMVYERMEKVLVEMGY